MTPDDVRAMVRQEVAKLAVPALEGYITRVGDWPIGDAVLDIARTVARSGLR